MNNFQVIEKKYFVRLKKLSQKVPTCTHALSSDLGAVTAWPAAGLLPGRLLLFLLGARFPLGLFAGEPNST
ncbi:MAG: hypothetical protein OXH94_04010 [Rhodospirillales bacterium]|nr:hypothetical protein [Rhodospirillales bacterium]